MTLLSDTDLLVPAFAERLSASLRALRGQGYQPVVHETLRSFERAEALAKAGRGTPLSMHCYGLAADVVCGDHHWDCRRHHWAFFDTMGACAEDVGLTWGGRWRREDLPHIQAVPVRLQESVRAHRSKRPAVLDKLVRDYLAGKL